MIDKENTIKKSKKKMEARYGISIVNIVKPSDDMKKYISILSREESLIYNRFTWSKEIDWHITLLRCHSLGNPIDMPNGYVEYLHKLFFQKQPFLLQTDTLSLDQDGVIRLHLSDISMKFWEGINIHELYDKSGLNYSIIYRPWITLAYSKIGNIDEISRDYECISDLLKRVYKQRSFIIDQVAVVKYSDSAFKEKSIESIINLGGTYG